MLEKLMQRAMVSALLLSPLSCLDARNRRGDEGDAGRARVSDVQPAQGDDVHGNDVFTPVDIRTSYDVGLDQPDSGSSIPDLGQPEPDIPRQPECFSNQLEQRPCDIPDSPCEATEGRRCVNERWESFGCEGLVNIAPGVRGVTPKVDAHSVVYLVYQEESIQLLRYNVDDRTSVAPVDYRRFDNCTMAIKKYGFDRVLLQDGCSSPGNFHNRIQELFGRMNSPLIQDPFCETNDEVEMEWLACQEQQNLVLSTMDNQNDQARQKVYANNCDPRQTLNPLAFSRTYLVFESDNILNEVPSPPDCGGELYQGVWRRRIFIYDTERQAFDYVPYTDEGNIDSSPRLSSRGRGEAKLFFLHEPFCGDCETGRMAQEWGLYDLISGDLHYITPGITRRDFYQPEELQFAGNTIAFLDLEADYGPEADTSRLVLANVGNGRERSQEFFLPTPHLREFHMAEGNIVFKAGEVGGDAGELYLCKLKQEWR